jgi:AmmeMemoRadiSam system protein A
MGAVERIEGKDLDEFFRYVQETGATICGRHSIGVLLAMLPEGSTASLLHYDTSGRMTGDYSSSVSYVAVAFSGRWPQGKPVPGQSDSSSLSDEDKKRLLRLARAALVYAVKNRRYPTRKELGVEVTPNMEAIFGAFVTLHRDGKLRGCIGEIYPTRPLCEAVLVQAINAGLNDRRFSPVTMSDLPELEFEISALTPPQPVQSHKEIVIGKHGIILEKNGRSAVFLPQVAVEQGWDLDQTLTQLALKAGLSAEAWARDATFTVFEAIVFGEGQE